MDVVSSQTVSVEVNGTTYEREVEARRLLIHFLRDDLDLTGTHIGCDTSNCGACTVHVNGEAVRSCQTSVSDALGKKITTIEGLSAKGDHPLQKAWVELGVPQCGFCQAGQLMTASALLKKIPRPTDEQIDQSMAGNLCRCGTYGRIREAIKRAAGGGQ